MDNRPIAVFDSGIGGLTVVKQIRRLMPNEKIIYFGDTARLPYGSKSPETIVRYALEVAAFLSGFDIKILVVACNSSSSYSIDALRAKFDFPVLGVIEPGSEAAHSATKSKRVGLIGTYATVQGKAYDRTLSGIDRDIKLYKKACPLFVPIVEEGLYNHPIARQAAEMYLTPLLTHNIDTLILGCTHYPLLKSTIREVVGKKVRLVDSAQSTARLLHEVLEQKDLLSASKKQKDIDIFVSDVQNKFHKVTRIFLGKNGVNINKADLNV